MAWRGNRGRYCTSVKLCRSRYKPGWEKRAVDVRAGQIQQEYVKKARGADRRQGVPEGEIGAVEAKLISLGEVQGVICGNFGEVSEPTHSLISAMATSRVRVAGPSRGRRGVMRSEDAERAMAVSAIRRRVGVATVRAQVSSLVGRLDTLGPGWTAASGRRKETAELERRWRAEVQAHALATRQGWRALRSGFAKLD